MSSIVFVALAAFGALMFVSSLALAACVGVAALVNRRARRRIVAAMQRDIALYLEEVSPR